MLKVFPHFIHNIHQRNQRFVLCFLLLIVVVGGAIRINIALHYSYFGGDPGRDMLVGRHIAYFGERLSVGHTASGMPSVYYYPPYYYYGIALLEKVNPSVIFIALFVALLQTLSIVVVYGIAEELGNESFAILSAFFFASSASVAWSANAITGFNFSTPLFLVSFFVFLRSIKEKFDPFTFGYSLLLLLLSASINYSSLPFALFYLLVPWAQKKYSLKECLIWTMITITLFILLWLPLWWYFGPNNFFPRFLPSASTLTVGWEIFPKIIKYILMIYNNLFWMDSVLYVGIAAIGIFVMFRCKKFSKDIIIPFCAVFFLVILAALKSGPVYKHNFTNIHAFVFMIISFMCVKAVENLSGSLKVIMIIYIGVLIYLFSNARGYSGGYDEFRQTRRAAEEIVSDATIVQRNEGYRNNNFYIVRLSDPGSIDWSTPALLYWIEIITEEKLVMLTNYYDSIEQINRDDYIFWLCRDFPQEKQTKECYEKYIAPQTTYELVRPLMIKTPGYYGYLLKKRSP